VVEAECVARLEDESEKEGVGDPVLELLPVEDLLGVREALEDTVRVAVAAGDCGARAEPEKVGEVEAVTLLEALNVPVGETDGVTLFEVEAEKETEADGVGAPTVTDALMEPVTDGVMEMVLDTMLDDEGVVNEEAEGEREEGRVAVGLAEGATVPRGVAEGLEVPEAL
jgi:hypothetical protein